MLVSSGRQTRYEMIDAFSLALLCPPPALESLYPVPDLGNAVS